MSNIRDIFGKTNTYDSLNAKFSFLRTVLALVIGVIVAVVVVCFTSDRPKESIQYLLLGPLMKQRYFFSMVIKWVPLVFTGLGVCLMFCANQFNLFAEGAFFSGALVAAIVAVSFDLPFGLHPVAAILTATAASGLLGAFPAIMERKLGANIMVSTIMMNNIVLFIGLYLVSNVFNDPTASQITTYEFRESAKLSELITGSQMTAGLFVAIIMIVIVSLYMYKTRWGYHLRLTGKNELFAKYAGVNVSFTIILTEAIGCALAGMGGAIEILGVYERFNWNALPGQGWDGVTLAIIAGNNPVYVPVASLFLAYLRQGADLMSIKTGLETDLLSIVEAVILIFLLANRFLQKYKNRETVKLSKRLNRKEGMQNG